MQSTPTSQNDSERNSNSHHSAKSSTTSHSTSSSSSSPSSSPSSLETKESAQHKGVDGDDIDKLFDILQDYKNGDDGYFNEGDLFAGIGSTANDNHTNNIFEHSDEADHKIDEEIIESKDNRYNANEGDVDECLRGQDDASDCHLGGDEDAEDEEPVQPRQLLKSAFIEVKEQLYVTAKLFCIGAVTFYYEVMSESDSITLRIGDVDDKKGYFFCAGFVDNERKDVRLFFLNKTMDKASNILLKNYSKSLSVRNSLKQNGQKLQQLIQSVIMMDHLKKFAESINVKSPMKIRQTLNHSSYTDSLRGNHVDEKAITRASKSSAKVKAIKNAVINTTKPNSKKSMGKHKTRGGRKRKLEAIEGIDYFDNFGYHDFTGGQSSPLITTRVTSSNCGDINEQVNNNLSNSSNRLAKINEQNINSPKNTNYHEYKISEQSTIRHNNNNWDENCSNSNANINEHSTNNHNNMKNNDSTRSYIDQAYMLGKILTIYYDQRKRYLLAYVVV